MLDDIGGKIEKGKLTLDPSWLLETSPGNYQAGYILDKAITDPILADQLMGAIVAAGLCDPGANGPTARLARLPVATNGKHSPPFTCHLEEWHPANRYDVDALVNGLKLDLSNKLCAVVATGKLNAPTPTSSTGSSIWQPKPQNNPVIDAIRRLGLYKSPIGNGKHDITCPWLNDHTGAVDSGTAYFEPDEQWPMGGFKCLHGHCAHRHISELLHHLQVSPVDAKMKAAIRMQDGALDQIVGAAEKALAERGYYYQSGGLIVRVWTDPGTNEACIQQLTQPSLTRALSSSASWLRFDKRSKSMVSIDPPARHTSVLYDSSEYKHLPVLTGISRQPYLRTDGSLVCEPDYDPDSRLFGVFNPANYSVPTAPSKKDAEQALELFCDLLSEFSFKDSSDESATLSAILTAAIRPSLPKAPMFHVKAHAPGSGKSYLCELITAIATPQRGTPINFPSDDDECRKLLLAELMRGPAVLEFDNLTSDLIPHKSLCTALTSEHMKGRLLGSTKMITVATRALFLSSGNNVDPIADMARRCITIRLSPTEEVPAQRQFNRPNLIGEVLAEREKYVSAALTIVTGWIHSGKPMSPSQPIVGFDEWSLLCRQSLIWLGRSDPAENLFANLSNDPELEIMDRLFSAWEQVMGHRPVRVKELVATAEDLGFDSDLYEALEEIAGEKGSINRRKLGWWLRQHLGRMVKGRKLIKGAGSSSAEQWAITT